MFADYFIKEIMETVSLGHLGEVVLDATLLLFERDGSCINVLNDEGEREIGRLWGCSALPFDFQFLLLF